VQIKNGKDFWAGLMFIGFGVGFMIISRNYAMGTAVRMGPAYFPSVLGGLLAVLGAMVFFRSFASKIQHGLNVFSFRPMIFVVAVVVGVIAWWIKSVAGKSVPLDFLYQVVLATALIVGCAAFGPRSLYIVLASVVLFAFLLKPIGLFLTTMLLVFISRAGGEDFEMSEVPKSIVAGIVILIGFIVLYKLFALGLTPGWAMGLAAIVSIAVSIWGGTKIKGIEMGVLYGVLGVAAVAVFVYGLGLPFNLCPEMLDDQCRAIGLGK
jgi:hypothetical protein